MKRLTLFALNSALITLHSALFAAVPLKWTVETSAANPATFDQFAGATYELEAALQSRGKPLAVTGEPRLYWQTNGMGSAWWSAPASASGNVLRATWTPSCDVGSRAYSCFIGVTGSVFNAAFQLRLRPSPGATPNELPLPTPTIDFAKVTVINPPWADAGIGTNDVREIARSTVCGAARPLPKYLHALDFDDVYPEDAAWYYAQPQPYGSCSARRVGGLLERNYDWKFDEAAEFVVRVSGNADGRFASIGVANCGTNLTEQIVSSGKPSRYYKCLPGRVVDGINERGVVCEVNVVDGDPHDDGWPTNGAIHCLGAVRWALDNATNAASAASSLAAGVYFPSGWTQNFHWMVADERETWIVEDGNAYPTNGVAVMTNFKLYDAWHIGEGIERYSILADGANITNVWYTRAYHVTDYPWVSDLGTNYESIWERWAFSDRESHRGEVSGGQTWWQTLHTSIYDITNRVLRIAVQEQDDWYTFALAKNGTEDEEVRRIAAEVAAPMTNALGAAISESLGDKRGLTDLAVYEEGWIFSGPSELTDVVSRYNLRPEYGPIPEGAWILGDPGRGQDNIVFPPVVAPADATTITFEALYFDIWEYAGELVATKGKTPTGASLAHTSATSGLAKFGEGGELTAATAGTDYIAEHQDISGKLDKSGGDVTGHIYLKGDGRIYTDEGGISVNSSYGINVYGGGSINLEDENALYIGSRNIATYLSEGSWNDTSDDPFARESDLDPVRTDAANALAYSRSTYDYMNGNTNAWFSGTNYVIGAESTNRTAFAFEDGMDLATVPCSMALWEYRDGVKQCVWDQRDWTVWYWNFKIAQYREEHAGKDAALRALIAQRAPLNWSSYTACGLTNAATDTTWLDTPKVVLSAGFAWQHQATVDGVGYWGIQGNGCEIGGCGTNATLKITDWEGNEVIKITKGSARLAYLTGGSGVGSGFDDGYMWYDMMCDAQPTGEFTVDLLDTFVEEGENCPAEVREYENRGNGVWRCYFRAKPGINATACFARFKVQVGTETTVEYANPLTISGGLIFNGRKIAPEIPANAAVGTTITWKVVQ